MFIYFLIILFCFVSILVGGYFFKKSVGYLWIDRMILFCLPFFFVVFFGLLIQKFLAAPSTWTASRLSIIFMMVQGHKIYYGEAVTGPLLNVIYPPMGFLSYWPATLFPAPMGLIFVAQFLAILFLWVPVGLAIFKARTELNQDRWRNILLLVYFVSLLFYLHPLVDAAFSVHVDAPALGWGAMACLFLYNNKNEHGSMNLILSSICAGLAVWSKQTMVPLLIVLPCYTFLTSGWRIFKNHLIYLFLAATLLSLSFLLIFGPSELIFNLMTLPSHQFREAHPHLQTFGKTAEVLFGYCLLPLVIILFCGIHRLSTYEGEFKEWFKENPWLLYVFVGIFLIPGSILVYSKLGSTVNALSYSTYFFSIASVLALKGKKSLFYDDIEKKGVLSIVILLSLIKATALFNFKDKIIKFVYNPVSISYRYILSHPGETYFPWNFLSHFIAEGKHYHAPGGILDREYAGHSLSDHEFRKYAFSEARRVAFPPDLLPSLDLDQDIVMKHLPEFRRKVELQELPGWTIYER